MLDGLAALIDQSLVQQRDGAEAETRFVMLETLREYALEQLDATRQRFHLEARHAADMLALAETAEPHLFAADRPWWLSRLSEEQDNARRWAQLGVATVVAPDERSPEAIRNAVRDVLEDPTYRRNAERLRDEMARLPGPKQVVQWLEQLVREKQPTVAAS